MGRKIEIKIPNYRAHSRNQTTKKHWTAYSKMRKEVSSLVFSYAKKRFEINPARVSISAFYKGKRCIDTSNIDDKIFVDALMDVGILKDDTPLENPEVVKRAYSQVGEDYVVITIEELESPESSSSAS